MTAILRGLALGLSAGIGCLGLCLPVAAPALFGRDRTGLRESAAVLVRFLGGRLVAYLLVGLGSGLLGARLAPAGALRPALLSVAYVLLGILLVLFGAVQSFPDLGLCRRLRPVAVSGWLPAILGFLAGVSPCPPFLLAVAVALDSGRVLDALLFFAAFYVGTGIYLLPLIFSGWAVRFGPVRTAARIVAVVTGLYFLAVGAARLLRLPG